MAITIRQSLPLSKHIEIVSYNQEEMMTLGVLITCYI